MFMGACGKPWKFVRFITWINLDKSLTNLDNVSATCYTCLINQSKGNKNGS